MKFLADENFPRPALLVLRDAGNDVRSVAEESPGLSDEEVAALCDRDERVLLTFDKDFGNWFSGRDFARDRPSFYFAWFRSRQPRSTRSSVH
jgi:predicted nuclease of predicted toxin-antitoxin system